MHRFFVRPDQLNADRPVVTGTDVKHIAQVLRMKPGDQALLLDGAGRAFVSRLESLNKNDVVFLKIKEINPGGESSLRVSFVQGLAKGEKMDLIVQKAVELGVYEIIPLICRRSVVRIDPEKEPDKRQRWQRVAMEAAKQCGRARIPVVLPTHDFDQAIAGILPGTAAFLPWEEERNRSLGHLLQENNHPDHVYVFIGPEGGFEPYEVEKALRHGVHVVTLGPRILRTETAGIACLSIIMHRWGDVG